MANHKRYVSLHRMLSSVEDDHHDGSGETILVMRVSRESSNKDQEAVAKKLAEQKEGKEIKGHGL